MPLFIYSLFRRLWLMLMTRTSGKSVSISQASAFLPVTILERPQPQEISLVILDPNKI